MSPESKDNWLGDIMGKFFEMATKEGGATDVVVGLAGEFSGGYASEHGMLVMDYAVANKDEEGIAAVNKMLNSHGGCDVVYLEGKLFFKDGKLCLAATEPE